MTDVPIWKQIRNYVEADPEHQRLSEAHRELRVREEELNNKMRAGTYKLQRLLAARDAIQHFANETECTTSEQDELLQQWTATHGESWCGMFCQAADDITELVLDLCSGLAINREQRDLAAERRADAYKLVRACADRLEAEYKEKHAGTCSG